MCLPLAPQQDFISERNTEEEEEEAHIDFLLSAYVVLLASSCRIQCCLGRSGSYLTSRPREAKPNRKVWMNHRQREVRLVMPFSLQGKREYRMNDKVKLEAAV